MAQHRRGSTGGAAKSVTADDLKNVKVKRVEELLVGRFPGVHVQPTPAGGFLVRIRGATMPGDRQPLYVVDGMPVEVASDRGLDWLDPADIARIQIVKDPAGTSMYGGRGANGVILISTKQHQR